MSRKLLGVVAFAAVLVLASHAWAPPPRPRPAPPPPRPTPKPAPPVRPPVTPPRPNPGKTGSGFPTSGAKPAFNKAFEAARAKSAADAAALLRSQSVVFITNAERAALLNMIALQMLRQQKQAATLAELRRLRLDWAAVGPGAGLDPIIAMELEAAESAAERLLLAEVLRLIRDSQFIDANAKLSLLDSPRYLPAAVVHALPELRAEVTRIVPFVKMQIALKDENVSFVDAWRPITTLAPAKIPPAVAAGNRWSALEVARLMLVIPPPGTTDPYTVDDIESLLKIVKTSISAELAGKLRVELSASLYLRGRTEDATKLLEGEVDPVHAAAVLADLTAVVLGRGELTVPQIAKLVPAEQTSPPPQAVAILPPDQLAKWKPPARKPGETTIDAAIADIRKQLKSAVETEVSASATKVNTAADRIRSALATEAGPQKAFLEKVEAMLGRPFASPVERQLALVAGTRGRTVAEAVGALSTEAHRPAATAKLALVVPAFTNPAEFALKVELSGRAPGAFAPHPDASFKLTGVRARARIRDAFSAILDVHAARLNAGQEIPPLERAALEADVAKRLGLSGPDALTPSEYVQGLLDVCRDWADDHARLVSTWRELDEAIKDARIKLMGVNNPELQRMLTVAEVRRTGLGLERQKREKGISAGCQLLGAYGKAGMPAAEWLQAQSLEPVKPWRAVAVLNLARITEE